MVQFGLFRIFLLHTISCLAPLAMGIGVAGAAPITFENGPLAAGWSVGAGQPNSNFVGVRDATFLGGSIELGLRAQQRLVGPIVPTSHNYQNSPGNNMYIVNTGTSVPAGSPPRAWWNFDLSIAYAGNAKNLDSLTMTIEELTGNLTPLPSFDFTGIVDTTLYQDSWNPTFNFLGGAGYDLNATGIYRITLTATEGGETVSTNILVNVGDVQVPVPEPTSLAVFGTLAIGGAIYGWRRRKPA